MAMSTKNQMVNNFNKDHQAARKMVGYTHISKANTNMFWKANLTLRCPDNGFPWTSNTRTMPTKHSHGKSASKLKWRPTYLLWLWLTINTQPAIPVYDRKHTICPRLTQSYFIIQKLHESRLVLDLPLWKIWVRQLGLWHSQYMESHKKSCSKAPSSNNGDHGEENVNYNG